MPSKTKIKIGDRIRVKFWDHSARDNADMDNKTIRRCKIEFCGWIVIEDNLYYKIEIIKCDTPGNSLEWEILKSTIIEIKKI